jgi:hypothetical protein
MDAPLILFDSDAGAGPGPRTCRPAYRLAFCRRSADSPASARYCAGDRLAMCLACSVRKWPMLLREAGYNQTC